MSYSITTFAHRPLRTIIPVRIDLSEYNLILEIGDKLENLQSIDLGIVDYTEKSIILSLSASEVDVLKDCYFRIKAVRKNLVLDGYFTNNNIIFPISGLIDYIDNESNKEDILDENGQLRQGFIPSTVLTESNFDQNLSLIVQNDQSQGRVNLDNIYVTKNEYVAGEGPSALLLHELIQEDLTVHIQDDTPHTAYDDLPSLKILFENGLI